MKSKLISMMLFSSIILILLVLGITSINDKNNLEKAPSLFAIMLFLCLINWLLMIDFTKVKKKSLQLNLIVLFQFIAPPINVLLVTIYFFIFRNNDIEQNFFSSLSKTGGNNVNNSK